MSQPAPIVLLNPSFEDDPWHSKPPRGWYYCGPAGETPPDVHPTGYFDVNRPADHGNTYLGMVVRDNGTWEAVGQHLQKPLLADQCYRFTLRACRSANYRSVSRRTGKPVSYDAPVRLRLWGGDLNCDQGELLAGSDIVSDTTWQTIRFDIQPRHTHHYIILEAFYPGDTSSKYLGNILVDNCSPFVPVDCRSHIPLFEASPVTPVIVQNLSELRKQARRVFQDIRFGNGTAELVNHYFQNKEGKAVQANRSLYELALLAQQAPAAKLIIAVRVSGKQLQIDRIEQVSRQLLQLGLPQRRFQVRSFRKKDRRTEWLTHNTDGDLYLQLKQL